MRPCGAFSRKPQHLRPERGKYQAAGWHTIGKQHVNVRRDRLVGLGVLLGRLAVPGPHAEQEPARMPGLDPGVRCGDLMGVALPHIDDSSRDHQLVGPTEQSVDDRQIRTRRSAEP